MSLSSVLPLPRPCRLLILLLIALLPIWRCHAQADPLLLTLTNPLPRASVGGFYDQNVGIASGGDGGPYHFQLTAGGGFPPIGIIMDINGRLSGTPKTPGTYRFTVSLVDLGGDHVEQVAELNVDPPNFAISDTALTEGNQGVKYFSFAITLNGRTNKTAVVSWNTTPGTARGGKAHTPGIDFQNVFATRVTFLPKQTRKVIRVPVYGDHTVEADEFFFVRLSKPIDATISRRIGVGTILNDDAPPPPPPVLLTVHKIGTGSGTVTPNPPGLSYANGTSVTLTATPAVGSVFVGWTGDASGTGDAVLLMNTAHSVTAQFDLIPPAPPDIHITSVDKLVTAHTGLYTDYTVTVYGTTTGTPGYYSYEAGYGSFGLINNTLTFNPEYWNFHFDYTQFNGGNNTVIPIWADIYDGTGVKASDQTNVILSY